VTYPAAAPSGEPEPRPAAGRPARPWLRWLVPLGAGALAVGGGALVGLPASAQNPLPARSAAQLLVDVQNADVTGLSGTVVQRADLGLPQLPLPGGQGSSDLTSLISGNHTLRLWYSGPDKARVALLGTLGESDVILNGSDLWTWSSKGRTATHRVVDRAGTGAGRRPGSAPGASPTELPLTPQQAAERALAAIDPSTAVSTEGTAAVAGRSAYELVLTPRTEATLVGQVRIAVDAREHVPLRVQVFARSAADPAVSVAFTQVSFSRPDAAQFRFRPPPGTTVTEEAAGSGAAKAAPKPKQADAAGPRPQVTGTGWSTVIGARLPAGGLSALTGSGAGAASGAAGGGERGGLSLERVLGALPAVRGSWGSGRLLSSALLSVLLTDDGRVYAGAVPAAQLYAAAATPMPAAAAAPSATAPATATAP
jgi:outer membrane lipoprotein-sorting protein